MIQRVAMHAADEDILVTIVVVVADGYAGIEAGASKASLRGDIA